VVAEVRKCLTANRSATQSPKLELNGGSALHAQFMKALAHFVRFLIGVDQPDSQVTDRELSLLRKYASDSRTIVEIGCYEGKTSVALAEASPRLEKLYSVDPFLRGRLGVCYGELIARMHRRRRRVKNIEFIKAFSHEAAPSFDVPIDFLFIDADHRYESIKRDSEDWFEKVRIGGVIALHDCKVAGSRRERLGSMTFYEQDLPRIASLEEIDCVDSMVILRVVNSIDNASANRPQKTVRNETRSGATRP
jgi:predicted O-methyltransferase YrrM